MKYDPFKQLIKKVFLDKKVDKLIRTKFNIKVETLFKTSVL